jgi:hypothetical protein
VTITGGLIGKVVLATENIKLEVLRVDFLVGAVGSNRLDRSVQLITQLGISFAHGHASARPVTGFIVLITTGELEVLAGIGLEELSSSRVRLV